jgi:hypothetical protein
MEIIRSQSVFCVFVNILLSATLFVAASGCGKDKDDIVRLKATEMVQDFRQKKSLECREILLREAEEIVDSLLLTEATDAMSDSLARLRPSRPMQPPAILPIDSLKVHPLFDSPAPAPDSGKKGG